MQARELIGNLLAREFGLQTPEPVIVRIRSEERSSLARHYEREKRYFSNALRQWSGSRKVLLGSNIPLASELDPDLLSTAVRTFILDMFAHHSDRTDANPNCSWNGDGLLLFDFEQFFPVHGRFMGEGPSWLPCARGLSQYNAFHRHVCGRSPDLAFIPELMERLQGVEWCVPVDELPAKWRPEATRILGQVREVAIHGVEFMNDIRESLR